LLGFGIEKAFKCFGRSREGEDFVLFHWFFILLKSNKNEDRKKMDSSVGEGKGEKIGVKEIA